MEEEQIHPLHDRDKEIIDNLIVKECPNDSDLVNLARLINRYNNFPGEQNLKGDLAKILNFWKLSKEVLFTKTRNIWLKDFKPQNTTKDLIGSGFDTSD
tara:strand:+ start:38 stop:334 length:297 start_codon:yes stop_codon:yes gene_type:complete